MNEPTVAPRRGADLRRALRHSPLYRLTHPRRTFAFGVGTNKSGTHSLAAMFRRPVRSAHEPEASRILDAALALDEHRIDRTELRRELAAHVERCWLDVEVSHPMGYLVDDLVALFPEARHVLTVRHPRDYLHSISNSHLVRQVSDRWTRYRFVRFGKGYDPTAFDEPFIEAGLFPVAGYLSYWRAHNERVLDAVPPEQLLVIRTDELAQRAEDIAAFLAIDPALVDVTKSHQFKTPVQLGLLDRLDPTYLADQIEAVMTPRLRALFD